MFELQPLPIGVEWLTHSCPRSDAIMANRQAKHVLNPPLSLREIYKIRQGVHLQLSCSCAGRHEPNPVSENLI
jgi:hypothetical protein